VNGRIYALGGDLDGLPLQSPLSIVHEYDPTTDTWTRKADMPTARWGLTAAVVEDKIYALGGFTAYGGASLSVLEVYDPATDTWQSKAAMPTRRGWFTTSVVDGKIFAIGAARPPSGPWLATVDMYDPLTDTWTPKASMPTARGALASSVAHGLIYVVGGRTGNPSFRAFSTVEEYDPATDTWTERTSLPSPRFHFRTSELNGRIYAIGGSYATGQRVEAVLSLVDEYTPPVTTPVLKLNRATGAAQDVLRLEWMSHVDSFDLLQMQDRLQPGGWTDVEQFSGTGETLSKDIPAVGASGFYRLHRELR
jgi:N-acetylneuraminic acid mutarotase